MHGNDNKIELELAAAERQVAACDRNVANQRAMIEELQQAGYSVKGAQYVLRELEDSRRLYVKDRDRLRKELGR